MRYPKQAEKKDMEASEEARQREKETAKVIFFCSRSNLADSVDRKSWTVNMMGMMLWMSSKLLQKD